MLVAELVSRVHGAMVAQTVSCAIGKVLTFDRNDVDSQHESTINMDLRRGMGIHLSEGKERRSLGIPAHSSTVSCVYQGSEFYEKSYGQLIL